ncbi:Homeobox protein HD-10 [Nosema bombycis CQ1]|uniref:Homeobox protein HD-10 n=1 Tax=Nosema bombycis (strain CQ1 / CVCC 102059) TaxID=578461 RepID=R0KRA6_NOSB1|nr:Homeobox protein HD-10 [Nosema bombycis CQ1]|eukprot:EOB13276.1 Homeobox protein HD-10 [Nosema bombycis CQ1]
MDNFPRHYFDSFAKTNQGEVKPQYYDPFYVKHRKRTTKAQLRVLEKTYETCPRPDSALRKKLGEQLGMTPRSVQVWFQNRRAKIKKQQQSMENRSSPIMNYIPQRRYKTSEEFELYPMNNSLTFMPVMYQTRPAVEHQREERYYPDERMRYYGRMYPFE